MLTTIGDAPAAKKTSLLREVEELGHAITLAKAAIATLRMDDITGHGIPFARDELEAIVDHTARATQAILESCETLDEVAGTISGGPAEKLQAATTRIYEACSFQHVTGRRIAKGRDDTEDDRNSGRPDHQHFRNRLRESRPQEQHR
jgi:chemotaxis protein CheZ